MLAQALILRRRHRGELIRGNGGPFNARERRRRAAFVAFLAALAFAVWLLSRQRPDVEELARAGLPIGRDAAPAATRDEVPSPTHDDGLDAPSETPRTRGRLTFADLDRLLGSESRAAALAFERELLDDPALPPNLKVAVPVRLESKKTFESFLSKLSRRGGPAVRELSDGLLAAPAAAALLRTELARQQAERAPARRDSRAGARSALAPRAAAGAGPGAHGLGRLAALSAVGKGIDAARRIPSMFASLAPKDRRRLAELCETRDLCDPYDACAEAGLLDSCLDACREHGRCPQERPDGESSVEDWDTPPRAPRPEKPGRKPGGPEDPENPPAGGRDELALQQACVGGDQASCDLACHTFFVLSRACEASNARWKAQRCLEDPTRPMCLPAGQGPPVIDPYSIEPDPIQ
ncbi:MAG: hypothetical protein HY553_12750 [Elusimicrobia bacterium]|nr:hypothetical protein [Elusimicrobiota bacterium]